MEGAIAHIESEDNYFYSLHNLFTRDRVGVQKRLKFSLRKPTAWTCAPKYTLVIDAPVDEKHLWVYFQLASKYHKA